MKNAMSNQSSIEWLRCALETTILTHDQVMQTIGLFVQAEEMESSRMQERFEEGRELGKIEILVQQSTSNASSYADGYKEGYKRALQLVQVKVNEKIIELKG
jgi:hypothetical protein